MANLIYAAGKLTVADVQIILEQDVSNINFQNKGGFTPLLSATLSGSVESVRLLLQYGADPNIPNNTGYYPIISALEINDKDKIMAILSSGRADINVQHPNSGETPLFMAVTLDDIDLVTYILNLRYANGHFVADREKKNNKELTPLFQAVNKNNPEMVKLLAIIGGADINTTNRGGFTPLMSAEKNNNKSMLNLLITLNGDFIYAATNDNIEAIDNLILWHKNPNFQNDNGDTALMIAVKKSNIEIIKKLVTYGADKEIKNNKGLTPLFQAVLNNNLEIVVNLVKAGAYINTSNPANFTILISAIKNNNMEMAKLLIDLGADLDYKNEAGFTALISAAEGGHMKMVSYLVEKGANINLENKSGYSALISVILNGDFEMTVLLIIKGANIQGKRFNALDVAKNERVNMVKEGKSTESQDRIIIFIEDYIKEKKPWDEAAYQNALKKTKDNDLPFDKLPTVPKSIYMKNIGVDYILRAETLDMATIYSKLVTIDKSNNNIKMEYNDKGSIIGGDGTFGFMNKIWKLDGRIGEASVAGVLFKIKSGSEELIVKLQKSFKQLTDKTTGVPYTRDNTLEIVKETVIQHIIYETTKHRNHNDCPYTAEIHGIFKINLDAVDYIGIMMEKLDFTLRWLDTESKLSTEPDTWNVGLFVQIMRKLYNLQRMFNFKHCDLHPGNIMLKYYPEKGHIFAVFIIDFGRAEFTFNGKTLPSLYTNMYDAPPGSKLWRRTDVPRIIDTIYGFNGGKDYFGYDIESELILHNQNGKINEEKSCGGIIPNNNNNNLGGGGRRSSKKYRKKVRQTRRRQ